MINIIKALIRPVYNFLYRFFFFSRFRYYDYYQLINKFFNYSEREEFLENAMEFVKKCNIQGDYLEFGVYEGDTFSQAFNFARAKGLKSMRFYAFDSFEGLPETRGIDKGLYFNKGMYSCNINKFKRIISKKGVNLDKVRVIQGWYDKVLNEKTKKGLTIKKASIIWIDCDLYESTVPVLNFITDYLQDGTIISFDDWFCFKGNPNKGEQKAFRMWLNKNPSIKVTEYHKFGWHGNSFIINIG